MTEWSDALLGEEIVLAYGKSLPAHTRQAGPFEVFGSNGRVGHHAEPLIRGPGIVIGRKGSVGEVAYSPSDFWPIDTTYYVVIKGGHDWRFIYHLLSSLGLNKLNSHSAVPGLNREDVYSIPVKLPPKAEQERIALSLDAVQAGLQFEAEAIERSQELKRAAMRELFTRGLRGEAQKETEIGPVPKSWSTLPLEEGATIYSSSRLGYGELLAREDEDQSDDAVSVLGIKVIDLARCDAEVPLWKAELLKNVSRAEAAHRCILPGAIVFPKNGAAVATNKKRRVVNWCVLDPNVMALHAREPVEQGYLYHWIQSFDLKSIVKPGPVPNFGKGDISGVLVPIPSTPAEQEEIVAILDAIDRKIDLHKRKKAVLEELFRALLHRLMTGEIRVADLDLSARGDAVAGAETAA